MTLRIHGSTGISGVDGSASAPAVKGTDTDTGIFFGNNTASIAAAGNERVVVGANGLDLNGNFVTNVVAMAANDIDLAPKAPGMHTWCHTVRFMIAASSLARA